MDRPNLLFLFTDEQRPDTLRAYGNEKIQTPTLDRLAEESVVFRHAYCTQPVCTPSRGSMLTGLYPHTHGCTRNNIILGEDVPCLPELAPGYETGYFGKWHLGDEIYPQHGFTRWCAMEEYFQARRPHRAQSDRSEYFHWLYGKGYKPEGDRDGIGTFGRSLATTLPEYDCKPAFLAQQTSQWLRETAGKPFIGYVAFLEPHMPFFGPRDVQYDPDAIDLPENFNHIPDETNHLKPRIFHRKYRDEGFERFRLDTEAGWRRLIANYWGLVSQVDAAVAQILATLDEIGQAENTIIVFTSDHGDMMGSHRLLAKTVMYEESVGVPWLMRVPGIAPRRVDHRVSQIDLVPTLLDVMGFGRPAALHGHSLRQTLETGAPPPQTDVFIEWNGSDSGVRLPDADAEVPENLRDLGTAEALAMAINDPVRTIITAEGWKLNYSPMLGQHELFDLNSDPYEMENRYGQDDHAGLVESLRARLRAWGARTGDTVAQEL